MSCLVGLRRVGGLSLRKCRGRGCLGFEGGGDDMVVYH